MSHCLTSRTIVIMGGTTGLGLSAAKACVEAGANVVVCGRNPESIRQAAHTLGPKARATQGDATHVDTAERIIELAVQEFGQLDGFFHVAGGSGRAFGDGPLHEVTDEGIEATLQLNLTSLIYSNRAAIRVYLRQGTGGTVLNMGSVLACCPSPKHFATHIYAAAKSAIIGFTRSCASYYAPWNIRCNVLAPALVETPMSARAAGSDTIRDFIRQKQPLDGGRFGKVDDLDAAALFFLSDDSRYITGQVLAVDGGWSVSEGNER